jgi:hypothetical protein
MKESSKPRTEEERQTKLDINPEEINEHRSENSLNLPVKIGKHRNAHIRNARKMES